MTTLNVDNFYVNLMKGEKTKNEFKLFLENYERDWRNCNSSAKYDMSNSMKIFELYKTLQLDIVPLLKLDTPYLRKNYLIQYQLKRLGFS